MEPRFLAAAPRLARQNSASFGGRLALLTHGRIDREVRERAAASKTKPCAGKAAWRPDAWEGRKKAAKLRRAIHPRSLVVSLACRRSPFGQDPLAWGAKQNALATPASGDRQCVESSSRTGDRCRSRCRIARIRSDPGTSTLSSSAALAACQALGPRSAGRAPWSRPSRRPLP